MTDGGGPCPRPGALRNINLREEPTRNDKALYLRGSLEDVEDLGVAEPLGEKLLAFAIFARRGNAHTGGGDFHHEASRVGLAHGGFLRVGDAAVGHPGSTPDQETRHLDFLAQLLQSILDCAPLMRGKTLWKLFAD